MARSHWSSGSNRRAAAVFPVALRDFLATEVASGAVLVAAAAAALLWAALDFPSYNSFWNGALRLNLSSLGLPATLRGLIDDGAMTLFFFVVGLEIRRELTRGELRDRRLALVPVVAACFGAILPAVVYLAIAGGVAATGWGIPMATDIAFALGVLALFGRGLPPALRVFLLTLAVADDVLTLLVIALGYSRGINWWFLLVAVALLAASASIHRLRAPLVVYPALGVAVWWLTLQSGVSPTAAGVALALVLPSRAALERLEHSIHPWSSFLVVPLFALANAGVHVAASRFIGRIGSPIVVGILLGRVLGKFAGITLGAWLATRLLGSALPARVRWRHVMAVGCVASVGFTLPLFVATIAFSSSQLAEAKLGLLLATIAGFLLGGIALRLSARAGPLEPAEVG